MGGGDKMGRGGKRENCLLYIGHRPLYKQGKRKGDGEKRTWGRGCNQINKNNKTSGG